MADFLNEDAVFICTQGGKITCKDFSNSNVQYNGAILLTTEAKKFFASNNCIFMTAQLKSPQPCMIHCNLGEWLTGFLPTKLSNNKSLLTDKATCKCATVPIGFITVDKSGVNGHVTTGSVPASMSINEVNSNNPATSDKNSAAQNSTNKNPTDNQTQNLSAAATSTVATQINKPKKNPKPKLLSKPSKNLFCPYNENNEACQNCEYPRSATTVDNNSKTLRDNYLKHIANENNRDEVDKHFLKVQDKFKFQAHHIISGNQIFKPHVELVRLANFCGYDINNALNCIMLAANEDDYGQRAGGKSASAYDTMSLSKIQWHVGGHSYKFSQDEEQRIKTQIRFYTKTNFNAPIQNYVQLVSAELDKIETALTNSCTCRNSPQAKRGLITRLNNLSQKIKMKLGAFTEKPQKSFPYYVSKEAYFYAFNLPRTAKIILVTRAGSDFLFEKFRAERFDEVLTSDSGKKLIFNPKGTKNFSLDTRESKIACIEFCDNVEFFILAGGFNSAEISFLAEEKFTKNIGGKVEGGAKFLDAHETEILVWLRDLQGDYQYTAINQKIKDRKNLLEASS